MVYDLSPGDVLHIGDAVTLTVVAVEGNLIRFGVETPVRESPGVDKQCEEADLKGERGWWQLN
jgi:hypothetical protein